MQLEMVGLGRMGSNMVRRLLRGGHQCVVFNRSPTTVEELVKEKATAASDLVDLMEKLAKPRTVWLMVPAAAVGSTIAQLVAHPEAEDILIEGGNSYIDDIERANELTAKAIHYVDVGTSGGVCGLERVTPAKVAGRPWPPLMKPSQRTFSPPVFTEKAP